MKEHKYKTIKESYLIALKRQINNNKNGITLNLSGSIPKHNKGYYVSIEIWSAILSGCPSVTDSDVNNWRPFINIDLTPLNPWKTTAARLDFHSTAYPQPLQQFGGIS